MSSTAQTAEGEKILIVDDDPGLSSLLERFFVSKGYRARTVPNTEQMDRLLAREVFNLVVLDLMLPGEDGLTACRRLRGANNQIPIIMLTAKGDELSRIKGLELAPTITWPSRSTPTSSWPGSKRSCAVNRPGAGCPGQRRRKRDLRRLRVVPGHPRAEAWR